MEKINLDQYQKLIKGAQVIEKDGFGLKVLDTNQGEMIKLFRRKSFFSTALFNPYAVRFVENSKQLTALNIPTINVTRLLWCGRIKRHIVVYERLAGDLLRDVLNQSSDVADKAFHKFGIFIAQLHDKGVYFRSAHLKNILVLPNNELGLIDISDMQIKRNSLGMTLRQRNFKHILRYQEDKDLMSQHLDTFTASYTTASHLNEKKSALIKQTIQAILANTQRA